MLSDRCPVCLSVLSCLPVVSVTLVHCGQTVAWIKMKLGVQVGLGPGHTVIDGDPALPPSKGHSPQFSAHICCGQMAGWIKMPLGMEVGHFVLYGDPVPPPPKEPSPQFSAHVYRGQTTGWIKMALGIEVGLGPGHIVLHWDAAPHSKRGQTPQFFGPFLLRPNGWMHEDATWYGGRPQPRRPCVM